MRPVKQKQIGRDTSWNNVANWYDEYLSDVDTYQAKVILPNLLRVLALKKGDRVLDLACGQGYFSRAMHEAGAKVIGIDASPALIEKAKAAERNSGRHLVSRSSGSPSVKENFASHITYKVATADRLDFLAAHSLDAVTIVLAIQNMENIAQVFDACAKALKGTGRLVLVMNHPAFRIPKASSWGWQEGRTAPPYAKATEGVQYRRVDAYMSDMKVVIDMTPGQDAKSKTQKANEMTTVSFHRPLQTYSKTLANAGFAIKRIEEWISHRESGTGPRKGAEDKARKEFPLFSCSKQLIFHPSFPRRRESRITAVAT